MKTPYTRKIVLRKKPPVVKSALDNDDHPQANPFDKWIDKQDLMQEFHISERTLHNWRRKKIIPFTYLGSKILYNRTKVEEILLDGLKKSQ